MTAVMRRISRQTRARRWILALVAGMSAQFVFPFSGKAQVTVKRGVSIYAPFMDRSPANSRDSNRTFGDPNILIEKGVLADIKAAGFDTIRMPVAPQPLAEQDDERLAASIEEIARGVDLILGSGLTALVDLHVAPDRSDGSS